MRTTVDIDDTLLSEVARRYPPGTPKTVLLEEGLRALLRGAAPAPGRTPRRLGFFADDGPLQIHEDWNAPIRGLDDP